MNLTDNEAKVLAAMILPEVNRHRHRAGDDEPMYVNTVDLNSLQKRLEKPEAFGERYRVTINYPAYTTNNEWAVPTIKMIRTITNSGLKEAKDIYDQSKSLHPGLVILDISSGRMADINRLYPEFNWKDRDVVATYELVKAQ